MDEFEAEEKREELKELQTKQDAIRVENSLLSEHLSRIVARKGSLQLHLERMEEEEQEKEEQEAAEMMRRSTRRSIRIFHDGPPVGRPTVRFMSPPRVSTIASPKSTEPPPMSTEEKVEIADEECNALTEQVEKTRAENDRVLDDLRAVYNEVKRSIRETRKDKNSFNREFVLLSELNPRGVSYTEDFLRYAHDKLRRKQNVRDKLQEKNDLLHMEIMEAEHQFSTKKDLKDILHAIDFDQLAIQNVQLHARIKDKTFEVWDTKSTIKNSLKALEVARRKLGNSVMKGASLRKSLRERRPSVDRFQDSIAAENGLKRKFHRSVVSRMQEEDGPPRPRALDYMECRNYSDELVKEIRTWTNKVEVAELTNAQLNKTMKQVGEKRSEQQTPLPPPVLVS